jgi:hypothetical protein
MRDTAAELDALIAELSAKAASDSELERIAQRGGWIGDIARSLIAACAICGASLAGKRKDAVYCGPTCRQRARRRRRREA